MTAPARRGGLQRKFFFTLLLVGILPGIAALVATYLYSTHSLKHSIGSGFQEIARSAALRLASTVDSEIDRAEREPAGQQDAELAEKRDLHAARTRVEEALGRINRRYAEAIRLRILEDLPREDVAKRLGVTVSTFDVVLHRALTALRKALAERGTEHGG